MERALYFDTQVIKHTGRESLGQQGVIRRASAQSRGGAPGAPRQSGRPAQAVLAQSRGGASGAPRQPGRSVRTEMAQPRGGAPGAPGQFGRSVRTEMAQPRGGVPGAPRQPGLSAQAVLARPPRDRAAFGPGDRRKISETLQASGPRALPRQNPPGGVRRNPGRQTDAGKISRAEQRRSRRRKRLCALMVELCLCVGILAWAGKLGFLLPDREDTQDRPGEDTEEWVDAGAGGYVGEDLAGYPQELQELFALNQEAQDYVEGYPDRESWMDAPIDLSEDFVQGQVPLLMQWDRRWGYNIYGDSMIGLAGCGPVCLTMAYLYLTEDTSMTPRDMADFAYENGYYTSAGTSWSLWTQGAEKLGISGKELSLDERAIHRALDEGGVVICSMRPGDFTTTGHFILIRGYDKEGFYVNDPNRRSNSQRQWDFQTLQYQIKNLWALGK